MTTAPAHYTQLTTLLREAATLESVAQLLGWDQETYMPPAGAATRAEQSAALASLVHQRRTDPRIGDLIAACESDRSIVADADSPRARNVREARRAFDKATKLPSGLVAELARVGSQSQQVWKEAREKNDFAMFAPWLERMFSLSRRKAECYGVPQGGELYDALIDDYEPGARSADIERVFTPLADRLSTLVQELQDSGRAPSDAPTRVKIDAARQHEFGMFVIKALGFDTNAGRLDVTTHPFCSGIAPGDTRLTTRYREERFTDALYGTMHECGHGLYEQGLPKGEHFGEPLGDSISLGIHESQSRMWENFVGRSRPFWAWALPHAKRILGPALDQYSADDLYRAVNRSERSFIRVEADESTYNLHVMLRFGIERSLLRGDLAPRDVPGAWNERFERLLGVKVPDDRRGCLQDVHWSFGLIGYFPTYTLGNLHAAQMWEKIKTDLPSLETDMARGEFSPLLCWLRTNVHAHGKRWRADELCTRITGKPLSADPLMRHLESKLRPIYGV